MGNNVYRRIDQHRNSDSSTFAGRYKTFRVVYVEVFRDVRAAIRREKEIKGWKRSKKEALISSVNPSWKDLSAEWPHRFRPDEKHKILPLRPALHQDDRIITAPAAPSADVENSTARSFAPTGAQDDTDKENMG
jgi:putative endonuclease